jgi:hypothetical protein
MSVKLLAYIDQSCDGGVARFGVQSFDASQRAPVFHICRAVSAESSYPRPHVLSMRNTMTVVKMIGASSVECRRRKEQFHADKLAPS